MSAFLDALTAQARVKVPTIHRSYDTAQAPPDYVDRLAQRLGCISGVRLDSPLVIGNTTRTAANIITLQNSVSPSLKVWVEHEPWRYGYREDQGVDNQLDPTNTTFDAAYLAQVAAWCDALCALNLDVEGLWLDSERFATKDWGQPDAVPWNTAWRKKQTDYINTVKARFAANGKPAPHCNIYGDGSTWLAASHRGWEYPSFANVPKGGSVSSAPCGDSRSPILAYQEDWGTMQAIMHRASADLPRLPIMPWVPFAWSRLPTKAAGPPGPYTPNAPPSGTIQQLSWVINNGSFSGSSTTPAECPRRYRYLGVPVYRVVAYESPNGSESAVWQAQCIDWLIGSV